MNELNLMNKKIVMYSLAIGILIAIVGGLIFFEIRITLGVLIGLFTGLLGYGMIVQMSLSLEPDEKAAKRKGAVNYIVRYLIYGLIFAGFVYLGFSVIALLIGFLCHKLSIFVYCVIEERNDRHARD